MSSRGPKNRQRAEEARDARELEKSKEVAQFQHDLSHEDTWRLISATERSARRAETIAIIAAAIAALSIIKDIIIWLLTKK